MRSTKAEYLLDNVDDLEDADVPTMEEVLDMDVFGLESDEDEVSEVWFSRLVGKRMVEP